jgi:DNA-binding winged helix-turn-helix (wHTH) protein
MEVLVDLAEHAGEVRSKRRLLHAVWEDAFVSDDVLTHAIWELRKAFGDDLTPIGISRSLAGIYEHRGVGST